MAVPVVGADGVRAGAGACASVVLIGSTFLAGSAVRIGSAAFGGSAALTGSAALAGAASGVRARIAPWEATCVGLAAVLAFAAAEASVVSLSLPRRPTRR